MRLAVLVLLALAPATPVAPDEAASRPPDPTFVPSEEVAPGTAVPFPVDI